MKSRSISSTQARARFGALLESLASDGPITITRHGRTIGVLSAKATRAPTNRRLTQLARLYSMGDLTWRDIHRETELDFGSLLVELGLQHLPLPRNTADKSAAQLELFQQALANGRK